MKKLRRHTEVVIDKTKNCFLGKSSKRETSLWQV